MAEWTLLLVPIRHHSISGWEDIACGVLSRAHHGIAIGARDGKLVERDALGKHLRVVNVLGIVRSGRHCVRILVVQCVGHRRIGWLVCALLGVCLSG